MLTDPWLSGCPGCWLIVENDHPLQICWLNLVQHLHFGTAHYTTQYLALIHCTECPKTSFSIATPSRLPVVLSLATHSWPTWSKPLSPPSAQNSHGPSHYSNQIWMDTTSRTLCCLDSPSESDTRDHIIYHLDFHHLPAMLFGISMPSNCCLSLKLHPSPFTNVFPIQPHQPFPPGPVVY